MIGYRIAARVLEEALGGDAVADSLAWTEAMECVWTLFYGPSQREAGFNWPWHMAFPGALLPPRLLREPPAPELRGDTEALVAAGKEALAAAQRMAAHTWTRQPLTEEMVATAASAPNTAVLNDHWTKLALLPERLAAMRDHLPELVANRHIRDPATV